MSQINQHNPANIPMANHVSKKTIVPQLIFAPTRLGKTTPFIFNLGTTTEHRFYGGPVIGVVSLVQYFLNAVICHAYRFGPTGRGKSALFNQDLTPAPLKKSSAWFWHCTQNMDDYFPAFSAAFLENFNADSSLSESDLHHQADDEVTSR